MTEEKEPFESWLKISPPPASDKARQDAIARGMEAFDQHFSAQRQGTPKPSRLMEAFRTFHHSLFGDAPMKKYQIIGGLCTIAIGVMLLNSSSLTPLVPLQATKQQEAQSATTTATGGLSSVAETAMQQQAPLRKEEMARAAEPAYSALKSPEAPLGAIAQKKKDGSRDKGLADYSSNMPVAPYSPPPSISADTRNFANGANAIAGKPAFAASPAAPSDALSAQYHEEGRDKFEHVKDNSIKVVKEEPVSTFSIDVDTSSYSFMRASLNNNLLPQRDAVRVEEMVNYFPYDYTGPESKETPFKANVAMFPTPWNSKTKLIHIGIRGYQMEQKEKPHSNLVFLIDTSGSMNEPNKLPLLKNSLKLLLDSLKEDDTVGIVTYAGNAGVALEPTPVKNKNTILATLDSLQSYGSTAGAEGIRKAYQLAEQHFDKEGVNRVILATDGDFNVGITDQNELKSFIERERNTGIFLSVLGFGMGNYNDAMMQALAQNGNGNAAYIDNLNEARKVLVEEASSTLFTIAKDVKIQVEFNPAKVAEYRLIGYETRMLNREDFNNDKVDAGDIGSGHTVTALYEITPADSNAKLVDERRYSEPVDGQLKVAVADKHNDEYAFVKIRYKLPGSDTSTLITTPVDGKVESKEFASAPQEARFATAVAAFAQLMRGEPFLKSYSYEDVIAAAQAAKGADTFGYRAEFINLVRLAAHAPKQLPALQGGSGGGVVPMAPTE